MAFGFSTILTMLILTSAGLYGLKLLPSSFFERYAHAFAGLIILFCGIAVKFLGI